MQFKMVIKLMHYLIIVLENEIIAKAEHVGECVGAENSKASCYMLLHDTLGITEHSTWFYIPGEVSSPCLL